MKLYNFRLSGHAHKVRLFLSLLNLDAEIIELDVKNKEHKSPEYLKKNRFGQFPLLEDGETIIADSHAILVYLSKKYDESKQWYPEDPISSAEIQRWLAVSAGKLAYGPAKARVINLFNTGQDPEMFHKESSELLDVMEIELSERKWLVGGNPTIADISNYTYIALAPEGNIDLDQYPSVVKWLKRIEQLPGFIPMTRSQIGLNSES